VCLSAEGGEQLVATLQNASGVSVVEPTGVELIEGLPQPLSAVRSLPDGSAITA
jgi:hypothetical protein